MCCLNWKRIDSEVFIYALLIRRTARCLLLELILLCYCWKRSGGLRAPPPPSLFRKKKIPPEKLPLQITRRMLSNLIAPPLKKKKKKARKSIQEHKSKAPSCVRIYGCNYSDMRYSWEQLVRLKRPCHAAETVPGLRIHSSKALSSQSKLIKSPCSHPFTLCVPPPPRNLDVLYSDARIGRCRPAPLRRAWFCGWGLCCSL